MNETTFEKKLGRGIASLIRKAAVKDSLRNVKIAQTEEYSLILRSSGEAYKTNGSDIVLIPDFISEVGGTLEHPGDATDIDFVVRLAQSDVTHSLLQGIFLLLRKKFDPEKKGIVHILPAPEGPHGDCKPMYDLVMRPKIPPEELTGPSPLMKLPFGALGKTNPHHDPSSGRFSSGGEALYPHQTGEDPSAKMMTAVQQEIAGSPLVASMTPWRRTGSFSDQTRTLNVETKDGKGGAQAVIWKQSFGKDQIYTLQQQDISLPESMRGSGLGGLMIGALAKGYPAAGVSEVPIHIDTNPGFWNHMRKVHPGVFTKEYTGQGGMIAWYPSPEVAKQLALPDGELPEELHSTLIFFPDMAAAQDKATEALEAFAKETESLKGKISGVGRFNASDSSEGKDVFYAVLDVPGLEGMYTKLAEALQEVPFAADHGFNPHITLKYLEPEEDHPLVRLEDIPITIDKLYLCSAEGKIVEVSLSGEGQKIGGIKLDLGCGENKEEGFIGIDKKPGPEIEMAQRARVLQETPEGAEGEKVIVKEDGKWILYSRDQSRVLGRFDTEKEAIARERQIQFFKHERKEADEENIPQSIELRTKVLKTTPVPNGYVYTIALRHNGQDVKLGKTAASSQKLAKAGEVLRVRVEELMIVGGKVNVGRPVPICADGEECDTIENATKIIKENGLLGEKFNPHHGAGGRFSEGGGGGGAAGALPNNQIHGADVKEFLAGSKLTQPAFHETSSAAAASITDEGVKLNRAHGILGDGFYTSGKGGEGWGEATVKVAIRMDHPLVVRDVRIGEGKIRDIVGPLRRNNPSGYIREKLLSAGYDGIIVGSPQNVKWAIGIKTGSVKVIVP